MGGIELSAKYPMTIQQTCQTFRKNEKDTIVESCPFVSLDKEVQCRAMMGNDIKGALKDSEHLVHSRKTSTHQARKRTNKAQAHVCMMALNLC